MHRALRQAAIVKQILCFVAQDLLPQNVKLELGELTKSAHQRILDIAVCHSSFLAGAIPILWSHVNGELRLFRALTVIPDPAVKLETMSDIRSSDDDEYLNYRFNKKIMDEAPKFSSIRNLRKVITTGEFRVSILPRFRSYTSSIRRLVIKSPITLGPQAYSRVRSMMGTVPLFPGLISATIPAMLLKDTCGDMILNGSAIRDLDLIFTAECDDHSTTLANGVLQLHDKLPSLRTLGVDIYSRWDKAISTALLETPSFVRLNVASEPKDAPRILSLVLTRPHLRLIELGMVGKRSRIVRHLDENGSMKTDVKYCGNTSSIWDFIGPIVSQHNNINRLDFWMSGIVNKPNGSFDEHPLSHWKEFYSQLASTIPKLEHLSITGQGTFIKDRHIALDIRILEPLLAISTLITLDLTIFTYPIALRDEDMARMGLAWPHLRAFEVQGPATTAAAAAATPTLHGLRALAQSCPLLERLKIPLDMSQVPAPSDEDRPHGLRMLAPKFEKLQEADLPAIADFIRGLFPQLKIEGVWLRKEVELTKLIQAA